MSDDRLPDETRTSHDVPAGAPFRRPDSVPSAIGDQDALSAWDRAIAYDDRGGRSRARRGASQGGRGRAVSPVRRRNVWGLVPYNRVGRFLLSTPIPVAVRR
jgi:hypothetical protein